MFDIDGYAAAGGAPFTFFVYHARLAEADKLPVDADVRAIVCRLLANQFRVGPWTTFPGRPDRIFIACPVEEARTLCEMLPTIEREAGLEPGFHLRWCEAFFGELGQASI